MSQGRGRFFRWRRRLACTTVLLAGCQNPNIQPGITYLGDADAQHYRAHATEIDYPALEFPTDPTVAGTAQPLTLRTPHDLPIRDLTLSEAIQIGLRNSEIIRSNGQFLSPGNGLYTNAERTASSFDPAIQESGVLFGGRGIEAALADFDTRLSSSLTWSTNDVYRNSAIAAAGLPAFVAENDLGAFNIGLSKQFAQGGTLSLDHRVNYDFSNTPGTLFPSAFSGNLAATFRQPLLAGAGAEFTRVAGPINPNFGAITGVSQGVVIARINNDLALADFEASLRNLVKDLEDGYWDLYLAYRRFDVAVTAHEGALATWRQADAELQAGAGTRADAAQARDQLFATRAAADDARSNIYAAETRYRRLLGLPVSDGQVLRPIDEPVTAEIVADWQSCLTEALTRRIELRRQKFLIKSLDLQLRAAENLTRPQLDLLADYRINGFGDHVFGEGDDDSAGTAQGLDSFYETLTQGDTTGWGVGLQFNVPVGFRFAHAQVRNYELRLTKAQKVLQVQEQEIAHELAAAFQEVTRSYAAARSNLNRYLAAEENVRFLEPRRRERDLLIDEFLRAQIRRAEAEVAYYTSLIDYNKALTNLQYRQERLLAYNNITVSEGAWNADAYPEADRRGRARSYASENPMLDAAPAPFISPAPVDGPEYTSPIVEPSLIEPVPVDDALSAPGDAPSAPPPPQEAAPPADELLPAPAVDAASYERAQAPPQRPFAIDPAQYADGSYDVDLK